MSLFGFLLLGVAVLDATALALGLATNGKYSFSGRPASANFGAGMLVQKRCRLLS